LTFDPVSPPAICEDPGTSLNMVCNDGDQHVLGASFNRLHDNSAPTPFHNPQNPNLAANVFATIVFASPTKQAFIYFDLK
jgi:hypothetical protein